MALVKSRTRPQSIANKRKVHGVSATLSARGDSQPASLDLERDLDPGLAQGLSPDAQNPDDPALYELALRNIEDGLASTRRAAARQLGSYPNRGSSVASACEAALLKRLPREEQVSVREAILTSVIRLAHSGVVLRLAECLRSDDAMLRNEVIEVLKQLPEELAPEVRLLLRDGDPDVRIFAVNVLESLKHPEVESWLIEVVESEDQLNVCASAVDLLAELGTEAARQPLLQLKARFPDAPYIQFAANVALSRLGDTCDGP